MRIPSLIFPRVYLVERLTRWPTVIVPQETKVDT